MLERERVVAIIGDVKVADLLVAPTTAPFLLHVLAGSYPGATLYLEGEPQDAASIAAMVAELAASASPSGDSPSDDSPAAPSGSPPGIQTLATADMVMRSLAQFQAETFASIIAASEAHLQTLLARDADFAEQMLAHRKSLREALEQLDVVDRGTKIAEVEANLRMHEAQARGRRASEGRTSASESINFGDVCEGFEEMTTGSSNPTSN